MRQTIQKVILLVLAGSICLVGCRRLPPKGQFTIDGGYRQVMGTFARVVAVADTEPQGRSAIDAAFEKIDAIEQCMSDYDPNSLLSKVNQQAFRQPVAINDELMTVLCASMECYCLSGGAFDITVGPVVQLWRQAKKNDAAPTPKQLEQARQAVGCQNLFIDTEGQTVQFAKEGMFLDLGGIGKGYAVDRAVEILRTAGLKGGMVDIGGNLRCFGTPANGAEHWLIGLQDPANDENILLKLKMDDRAVATSGDYRRFVVLDGQKHSHIINPATADSAQSLSSVTIIAPTAMAADALSTTVTVLGDQKGLGLIESITDVEAILIPHSEKLSFEKTSAADRYIMAE
ncbi:MAG: FAD:protein FMN transferase [Phycisphaerae bacterium]|nr:FAD:protein FMN transferase [Phycisphaerae bacterium]